MKVKKTAMKMTVSVFIYFYFIILLVKFIPVFLRKVIQFIVTLRAHSKSLEKIEITCQFYFQRSHVRIVQKQGNKQKKNINKYKNHIFVLFLLNILFLRFLCFANYTKNNVLKRKFSFIFLVCIWWFSDIPRLIYRTLKLRRKKEKRALDYFMCCLFELKLINPEYPCMLHKE